MGVLVVIVKALAKRVRLGFVVALLLPAAAQAQVQINQTFIPQGPAPATGRVFTDTGAVQAVLPDPALGANTVFIGSTNGEFGATPAGLGCR